MNTAAVENRNEKIALFFIIIVSAVMHFINLGSLSLSNDELSALSRIRFDSFSEMIEKGVYIDFHPAGVQTFLYYWVKIFGDGPFIVRLPFVICSLISIWAIYQIGKTWFNSLSGLLASACFAFLSFPLLFTQLARMYSPGIMLTLLSAYAWTKFLIIENEKEKIRWLIGWTIFTAINLHLHYFSFMASGLIGLSGLFIVRKKDLAKYIRSGIVALITFIPEIPVFVEQMKTGDIGGWLGPPSKYFLAEFFLELFNRSVIICSLVSALFIGGIIFSKRKPEYLRWRILSVIWFLISFGIAYVYSALGHPVLTFSTLLFTLPFLLLTIFSFIPDFLQGKIKIIAVFFFSLYLVYDTIVPSKYYSRQQFGVFKEIAEDAVNWMNTYGRQNVSVAVNVINENYINYYFSRLINPLPVLTGFKIETPADFAKFLKDVDSTHTDYFAYIWSNAAHPFEVPAIIRSKYPYLIEKKNYFNAGSYLFSKHPAEQELKTQLFSSRNNYENEKWSGDPSKITTEIFHSSDHSERMDNEYSNGLKLMPADIPGKGYRYISFKSSVFAKDSIRDAIITLSFERDNKPYSYHGVFIKEFNIIPNKWNDIIIATQIPEDFIRDETLMAYIWNPSHENFYVDDLEIQVHQEIDPWEQFSHWKRNLFY